MSTQTFTRQLVALLMRHGAEMNSDGDGPIFRLPGGGVVEWQQVACAMPSADERCGQCAYFVAGDERRAVGNCLHCAPLTICGRYTVRNWQRCDGWEGNP